MRRKELAGKRFGRLTALEMSGYNKWGHVMYRCVCDCGREKIVSSNGLVSGRTLSCGCLHSENAADQLNKYRRKVWEAKTARLIRQHTLTTETAEFKRIGIPLPFGKNYTAPELIRFIADKCHSVQIDCRSDDDGMLVWSVRDCDAYGLSVANAQGEDLISALVSLIRMLRNENIL